MDCPAELTHAHGVSQCRKDEGHQGRHAAYCAICTEYEEGDLLEWDAMDENWTKP